MSEPGKAEAPALAHGAPEGVGLRGQITLALVLGLGLFVVLTAVSADRLATRALERERTQLATVVAGDLAREVRRTNAPPIVLDHAEELFVGQGGVLGFEVRDASGAVDHRGLVTSGVFADATIDGGSVRAWVLSPSEDAGRSLVGLIVLYASVGAVAILVLSFVLLTRLIVRPVEALTRASEKLASGKLDARAPIGGAAEVARLSVAFNAMAADLKKDRAALDARVAELEKTTRELRAAQDSLVRSEKLASVGRLSAGIAHEIGNPLTSILGLVELLREGGLTESEQAEFLRRIQGETERIHRIIRDLLDFARARPAEAASDDATDLALVVDRAVTLVAPQKDLRRIAIERRIEDGLPKVRGSEDRWTQVVLNLLLNAADAIEGEGAITIGLARDDDAGRVRLTVSDTGPGIAPSVRAKLFEPFVTTKPPGSGTGLGLAVCLALVEDYGGTMEAGDAPGGGARFTVHAPPST
jgi:C4-dicarboxylate-specific signal transduction histidine kinase